MYKLIIPFKRLQSVGQIGMNNKLKSVILIEKKMENGY